MTALPVVLIIGASRGLGLALAREWLSRGWTVIATGPERRTGRRAAGDRSNIGWPAYDRAVGDDRRRGGQGTSGTAFEP
jgi:NAD(P)-dependent dehydrogenase (short-subunit alcohol dehydrogenase family)